MLAHGNVPVQYGSLAGGFVGTEQTVALMRQLATGKYGSRSPKIRALGINILRQARVPAKDYVGEMVAIHNWVRDNCRYTRDVAGQETLCPPEEIAFNTRAGDCDDLSMLDAALLGAVGITSRFVTIGVTPDNFSHVYLQARPQGEWISLDPIMRNQPAGWEVPASAVKLRKVYSENAPEDTSMNRPINGLGYVGDPRVVSHLSPEPRPQGQAAPYVVMDSFLDSDRPMEEISRNLPAFPQQTYDRMAPPVATQRRPVLGRTGAVLSRVGVAARSRQDAMAAAGAEQAAMNPGAGMNGVYTPDMLAGMGGSSRIDSQMPRPNMQRPAMAQTPEGVDHMFTRPNMIMRGSGNDTVIYRGLYAMNEKPPVRPYTGMAGVRLAGRPGIGGLAGHSLSGPGLAELADLAADPAPAYPVEGPSKLKLLGGLALVAAAAYLLCKRK